MVGNVAAELAWSRAADVQTFVPGFPLHGLDRGLRFSIERTTALQSYASLVWAKVQAAEAALMGSPSKGPINRFGLVEDMQALETAFANQATGQLERWKGRWQEGPWFDSTIRTLVHARGALSAGSARRQSAIRTVKGSTTRHSGQRTKSGFDVQTSPRTAMHMSILLRLLDDTLFEDGASYAERGRSARLLTGAWTSCCGAYWACTGTTSPRSLTFWAIAGRRIQNQSGVACALTCLRINYAPMRALPQPP